MEDLATERKERRDARVKKRRGAAEEDERREEGVVGEGEEVEAEEEEKMVLVGSREFWRWRRWESIAMKASSIFTLFFFSPMRKLWAFY